MIQWYRNLGSVSHTEASSDIWDDTASTCCFTGQGSPVGPASYPTPRPGNGRASQTIFAYIWATDIIIKAVFTGSCSTWTKATFRFSFHRRRKKSQTDTRHFFSLSFFFFLISGQQTKKSMTPAALIDISVLNENGSWFQFKWQHWVID